MQNQLDVGKAMTEHPQDPQPQQPYGQQPGEPMPPYSQQPGEPMPPYSPQAPRDSGPQPSFQPVPMTPADQRSWAIATHLSPFLALFIGGLSFLGPLITYLVFRDRGAFIRHHTAETLNFQLTMWIGLLISVPLMFVIIGFFTFGAILVAMLVCHILGAVAASEGRFYRYPFTIRFVS
jgi:uncharacterized Tic20 family protein